MNIKGLMTYVLTVYTTVYRYIVTHELFDCSVQASQ